LKEQVKKSKRKSQKAKVKTQEQPGPSDGFDFCVFTFDLFCLVDRKSAEQNRGLCCVFTFAF
jgi:hypothetical protein